MRWQCVSIKDVKAGMTYIDAGFVVIFVKGVFRRDGQDFLA
jgi:hypothetical protein